MPLTDTASPPRPAPDGAEPRGARARRALPPPALAGFLVLPVVLTATSYAVGRAAGPVAPTIHRSVPQDGTGGMDTHGMGPLGHSAWKRDTDDTLVLADSPQLAVSMLREPDGNQPGATRRAKRVTVPAHSTLRMAQRGIHVAVLDPPPLKPGQKVSFNLWFEDRGRVGAEAVTLASNRS